MMNQTVFERDGYLMRSYSETRWADMLDALHIGWLYEPSLVTTRHGAYLPDFYLPMVGMYVEVKGPSPTQVEREKALDASIATGAPVIIAYGDMHMSYPGVGGARLVSFAGPRDVSYSMFELHKIIREGLGDSAYKAYLRAGNKQTYTGCMHGGEILQDTFINSMERSTRERHLASVSRGLNARKLAQPRQMSKAEWGLSQVAARIAKAQRAAA